MVLSQFTIATVALQNRIPEEVVDMNDEEKKAFQEKTVKEFEVIIKNNPEKMKQEYLEAITNTTPSLLFVQNILWLVCFVIPMYFFFNKVIRVKVNDLMDELGSTAKTATFFPMEVKYFPNASINVLFPTPGTPVIPILID